MKLPNVLRPRGGSYRRFIPGYHLPYNFWDDLKSIDTKLYLVWHPYRVLYDDVMNQYTGNLDDPRFCIQVKDGLEIWGWMPTDNFGNPIPENKWHIWRLHEPHGYTHVAALESADGNYLSLVNRRLNLQARFKDRYGARMWQRELDADLEKERSAALAEKTALFDAVQEENQWLMKKAMENFERGIVDATNPEKETIVSYPGQVNRSKIVRPLDDREGGLIIPEGY